jgi:hypothetical protein
MSSPTLIIGDGNWAVKSGSLLGYEYGELSGQYAPIPITGSRASSATYTDQAGTIVSASTDILRVDYTYTTPGSLLLEPQRTNTVLFSEDLTNANWVKTNVTASSNSIVSPNGTQDADTLTATATTGQHQVQNGPHTSGSIMASIFAQKGTISSFQIFSGVSSQAFANFNLDTGTVGTSGSLTLGSIRNIGNGWYRCNTFITASAGSTIRWALVSSDSASYGESWTTSGTESIYLWGGQVEVGTYPTTYIPTAGSTVTRLVDSFNRSSIFTDGTITVGGGTWYLELLNNVAYVRDALSQNAIGLADTAATTTNSFTIRNTSNGVLDTLGISKRVSGTSTFLFLLTTSTVKVVIKWNGSTADVFVNGVKEVSATAFTATALDFLVSNGIDVPKFIPGMKLYDFPLPDAECISLTTL